MRDDHYEGKTLGDPEIRALFTRESVLASDWYRARLAAKQRIDARLWEGHVAYLENFLRNTSYAAVAERMGVAQRLDDARAKLAGVNSAGYVESLVGTTGAEPAVPVR
jgi:selenocysteine lyase/cysteine desulfurase